MSSDFDCLSLPQACPHFRLYLRYRTRLSGQKRLLPASAHSAAFDQIPRYEAGKQRESGPPDPSSRAQ